MLHPLISIWFLSLLRDNKYFIFETGYWSVSNVHAVGLKSVSIRQETNQKHFLDTLFLWVLWSKRKTPLWFIVNDTIFIWWCSCISALDFSCQTWWPHKFFTVIELTWTFMEYAKYEKYRPWILKICKQK